MKKLALIGLLFGILASPAGALLAAPSLSGPSNGATGVSTTPTFSWSSVSGANRYWLVVSTSQGDLPTDTNATSCPGCISNGLTGNTTSTSYTPPTSFPNGGTTRTLSAGTTYYWKVQAWNTNGTQGAYSSVRSFTTASTLLPAPSLSGPSNGATGVSTTPTFSWSSVSGANRYWLVVSTSQGDLPTDTNATSCPGCISNGLTGNTTSTSYTPPTSFPNGGTTRTLSPGTTYYWKVQAWNTNGTQGAYSGVRSFTTASALLPAPSLSGPSNGATEVSTTPTFSWSSVSGANRYWLVVSTSQSDLPTDTNATSCPQCVTNGLTGNTTSTSYTPPTSFPNGGTTRTLIAGTTYYWKVQAWNTNGTQGAYSSVRSFTTASALLPAPSLSGPSNGATGVSTTPAFSWSSVSGANRYWLVVSTSQSDLPTDTNATSCPGCISNGLTGNTTSTSYTPPTSFPNGGTTRTLSAGTTYYWKVQAWNTNGTQGNYSSVRSFTTQSVTAPGEFTISVSPACNGSSPQNIVTRTNATNATSYDVYRNDVLIYSNLFGTTFTNTSVSSGATFTYYLKAKGPGGTRESNRVTMTTSSTCGLATPQSFTISAATSCNGTSPQIVITRTASANATSYDVYRNGTLIYPDLYGTMFTNTSIAPGTSYSYFLRAKNAAGTIDSNTLPITSIANCNSPTPGSFTISVEPSCSSNNPSVVVTRTNSSNASYYEVYRNGLVIATPVYGTSYTSSGLNPSSSYQFKMRAVNGAKVTFSNEVSVTTFDNCTGYLDDYPYKNKIAQCSGIPGNHCAEACPDGVDVGNNGFYAGQCTSWVAWRINQRAGTPFAGNNPGADGDQFFTNWMGAGHWGNADNWDNNAQDLGWQNGTPAQVPPSAGDILQKEWRDADNNLLFHVRFIEKVYPNGNVDVTDYNQKCDAVFRVQTNWAIATGWKIIRVPYPAK